MSETFSREYLQSYPAIKKQEYIHRILRSFHNDLLNAAAAGLTSFKVDERLVEQTRNLNTYPPQPNFTDAELVTTIQAKYPECKVTYVNSWVGNSPYPNQMKKGVLIDWS